MSDGLTIEYKKIAPFKRGTGVETRLMVSKDNVDATPFTTGTTRFPVGRGAPMHSHNCAEQVTILDGTAEAVIGDDISQLGAMDTTFVPPGVPHSFNNIGEGPLMILWIYGARDVTRTFTKTGETVAHLSPRDQV